MLTEEFIPGEGVAEVDGLAEARASAARMHEKWVVGYGHASVAEHANVSMGIEGCSILAAKAIEDRRLGVAYTEKSTRYVKFGRGSVVTRTGFPASYQNVYMGAVTDLFETYDRLVQKVQRDLGDRYPHVSESARRAKSLDLLRGLIPVGAKTSLGITANARALAHLIRGLMEDGLPEHAHLAGLIREEGLQMVPTLLRYVEPSTFRARGLKSVRSMAEDPSGAIAKFVDRPSSVDDSSLPRVALIEPREIDPRSVARSILEHAGYPDVALCSHDLSVSQAEQVIVVHLRDREDREGLSRAFEDVSLKWFVACDYGAWRDLQRHRIVSATRPRLDWSRGYVLPHELADFGTDTVDEFMFAMDAARCKFDVLRGFDPDAAQYAVPLAARVAYTWRVNLREALYIVRLRSSSAGNISYRRIAQQMAKDLLNVAPWIEPFLKVDWEDYEFAREPGAQPVARRENPAG